MNNEKILNFKPLWYKSMAEKYGLPYYIYKSDILYNQVKELQECFEDFTLLYSVKANPYKELLACVAKCDIGIDAASIKEVLLAKEQGIGSDQIYYSAPGKTYQDLQEGIDHSHIIADSLNELFLLNELCSKKGTVKDVGIRINLTSLPLEDDLKERMSKPSSKFGIDLAYFEQNLSDILALNHIHVTILHVYVGSQILSANVLNSNIKIISAVALELIEKGMDLREVNYGGGFGFPCSGKVLPLDLRLLKKMLKENVELKRVKEMNVKCIIESGRFLIAGVGEFVTDIVDIKKSGGEKYYILQGIMNQFFRPVFMNESHDIVILSASSEVETVHICGNLCTPLDEIFSNEKVPKAQKGDLVIVKNAGAYGKTMSLNHFISHKEAIELLVNPDFTVIK